MGTSPSSLGVVVPLVKGESKPAANAMDNAPGANVKPFGMCNSPANPAVAAATAAALGVLTPQPCAPVIAGPWSPGSPTVKVRGQAAVDDACKLSCAYGGSISVSAPGQGIVTLK